MKMTEHVQHFFVLVSQFFIAQLGSRLKTDITTILAIKFCAFWCSQTSKSFYLDPFQAIFDTFVFFNYLFHDFPVVGLARCRRFFSFFCFFVIKNRCFWLKPLLFGLRRCHRRFFCPKLSFWLNPLFGLRRYRRRFFFNEKLSFWPTSAISKIL